MARPSSRTRSSSEPVEQRPNPLDAVRRHWVGILVTVAIVGGLAALVAFDPPPPGVQYPSLGNQHIQSVSEPHIPYNSSPPSSGPHVGLLARWGVHEEPVPPELFIHNLEDAGIVLAYDCPDGCPEFVEGLAQFIDRGRVLVTPYEGIVDPDGVSHRGAAVAWTRVFYFDELDEETLKEIDVFIRLYEGIDHHVAG